MRRQRYLRFILMLVMTFLPLLSCRYVSSASDGSDGKVIKGLEHVSEFGMAISTIAAANGYVYVGCGHCLYVLDYTKEKPIVVGVVRLPSIINALTVDREFIYVPCEWSGLHVISVADLAKPIEVGRWVPSSVSSTGWSLDAVTIANGFAYVPYGSGVIILNLENPTQLKEVGFFHLSFQCFDIAVANGYAYCATGSAGLSVVDVSNPSAPVEVGSWSGAWVNAVEVAGEYLYLAVEDKAGELLRVLDISDRKNPRELASCKVSGSIGHGVRISGKYAYLLTWNAGKLGYRIIDIANPIAPKNVGFYNKGTWGDQGISIVGKRMYVTDGECLYMVNVANPAKPLEVSRWYQMGFQAVTYSSVSSIAINGHFVYTGGRDLALIDINEETHPKLCKIFPGWGFTKSVIADGYMYMDGWKYDKTKRDDIYYLRVLDVTKPEEPKQCAIIESGRIEHIIKWNKYIYLITIYPKWALQIFEHINRKTINRVGYLDLGLISNNHDIKVGCRCVVIDNYLFIAYRRKGLQIIAINDIEKPKIIKFIPDESFYQDLLIFDNRYLLWLTGDDNNLMVIDITEPINPIETSRVQIPSKFYCSRLIQQGNYVFAGSGSHLYIIDLSKPYHPEIVTCFRGVIADIFPTEIAVALDLSIMGFTTGRGGVLLLKPQFE